MIKYIAIKQIKDPTVGITVFDVTLEGDHNTYKSIFPNSDMKKVYRKIAPDNSFMIERSLNQTKEWTSFIVGDPLVAKSFLEIYLKQIIEIDQMSRKQSKAIVESEYPS